MLNIKSQLSVVSRQSSVVVSTKIKFTERQVHFQWDRIFAGESLFGAAIWCGSRDVVPVLYPGLLLLLLLLLDRGTRQPGSNPGSRVPRSRKRRSFFLTGVHDSRLHPGSRNIHPQQTAIHPRIYGPGH